MIILFLGSWRSTLIVCTSCPGAIVISPGCAVPGVFEPEEDPASGDPDDEPDDEPDDLPGPVEYMSELELVVCLEEEQLLIPSTTTTVRRVYICLMAILL